MRPTTSGTFLLPHLKSWGQESEHHFGICSATACPISIPSAGRNIAPRPESKNKQSMKKKEKKSTEIITGCKEINWSCVNSLQTDVGHGVQG